MLSLDEEKGKLIQAGELWKFIYTKGRQGEAG
jgi:hypothetical protein